MPRVSFALAASLVAVVGLAACSASPTQSPASPSPAPITTPEPSGSPLPAPSESPGDSPRPTAPGFTADEQALLDGIQRGAENCRPADELPDGAIAGIECDSDDPAVARIGFYRFATDEDMLDAYIARMEAEGVELESGSCNDGEAEHAYIPSEEFAQDRSGCFLNEEGVANYRYTVTGDHVYVGILGTSADTAALESFAWLGNQDAPGMPTLWYGGID